MKWPYQCLSCKTVKTQSIDKYIVSFYDYFCVNCNKITKWREHRETPQDYNSIIRSMNWSQEFREPKF